MTRSRAPTLVEPAGERSRAQRERFDAFRAGDWTDQEHWDAYWYAGGAAIGILAGGRLTGAGGGAGIEAELGGGGARAMLDAGAITNLAAGDARTVAALGAARPVALRAALRESIGQLRTFGTSAERARFLQWYRQIQRVQSSPSLSFQIAPSRALGAVDLEIFGTADSLGITTITTDARFVRTF